jgi:argininosuccinate lyase
VRSEQQPSGATLREWCAKLVDVRSAGEFNSGHLPGALNIPLGDLGANAKLALPRVTFHPEKCRVGVEEGFTQATDLAEALVKKGMPFRKAYQVVGSLVRRVQEQGLNLRQATVELAQSIDPALDAQTLAVLEPSGAVARKASAGSTGPAAVEATLVALETQAKALGEKATKVPRLAQLFTSISTSAL